MFTLGSTLATPAVLVANTELEILWGTTAEDAEGVTNLKRAIRDRIMYLPASATCDAAFDDTKPGKFKPHIKIVTVAYGVFCEGGDSTPPPATPMGIP